MIDRGGEAVRLRPMDTVEAAHRILDTMLGHLGFSATIEVQQTDDGPCLQIHTGESEILIGKDGDRLDDFQYLVNRILRRHYPKAERVKVDCGHFRSIQEDRLQEEVRSIAERVKATGKPFKMRPLNAYYRRLVHNVLVSDPAVVSSSPGGDDRLKRITISAKPVSPPAE
jgi:spoIIIJ-associated protein